MSLIFNLQERHIISADNGDDDDFKAWFFKNRQVPYTAQKMKFSIEVYLIFCAVLIAALSFPNLRTRHVMSRNRINSHRKSVHIKKNKQTMTLLRQWNPFHESSSDKWSFYKY